MPTGSKRVIDVLNDVLTAELTAINQYFVHGEMCEHWGYHRLQSAIRKESIDEMKHAESLIERVLFLSGIPNVQRLGKVNIGENVPEMLRLDRDTELEAIRRLNEGIKTCTEEGDHGTRQLLDELLESEEHHVDWLEAQLDLIAQVGEQNYLAQQIHKS